MRSQQVGMRGLLLLLIGTSLVAGTTMRVDMCHYCNGKNITTDCSGEHRCTALKVDKCYSKLPYLCEDANSPSENGFSIH
jgi:hypothetical protein